MPLYYMRQASLRIDKAEGQDRLHSAVQETKPKLLFLDPFIELSRVDENRSVEVVEVLNFLQRLGHENEMSVILTHHSRKPGTQDTSNSTRGYGLRGSSVLRIGN